MRTLLYKRTHKGDPDREGSFGIWDCMGRVRRSQFDAVIGIGGAGNRARAEGIGGKVNWIGVGPRKETSTDGRGPLVTFDHFVLFEEEGHDFRAIAPNLALRMYSPNAPRFLLDSVNEAERAEVDRLLELAENAPPSVGTPRRWSHARSGCRGSKRCIEGLQ